jgi:cobalt-zinc-cadmium efflux system membrane fusion protein
VKNVNNEKFRALALGALLFIAGCGGTESAHDEHGHDEHGHDEHGHDEHGAAEAEAEPDFARVSPERAPSLGIVVAPAQGGDVAETVTLTGRLIIDPKRIAAVRARFPGPVVRVHKEPGQPVARGDVLADVESNESLTVYEVRSPLAGVVLERLTNVGDVAGTEPLYRVGDVSRLQAELKAFPSQRAALAVGARARIDLGEVSTAGKVVAIAPEIDGHTQALNVRLELEPPSGVALVPGQFVTGTVERGRTDAAVAVPFDAVQRLDGRDVVFVPEADGFRARPVTVGRRGATHVEIREGLEPDTRYVTRGAFLLKAEIGKNEAAHEH